MSRGLLLGSLNESMYASSTHFAAGEWTMQRHRKLVNQITQGTTACFHGYIHDLVQQVAWQREESAQSSMICVSVQSSLSIKPHIRLSHVFSYVPAKNSAT